MFNMNVKMKFIEFKSMGMPMYKIANELGVHRATIMRWNRELAPYILIAKEDMINEMLFENGCMKLNRIEKISKFLTIYYSLLEESGKDNELNISSILDKITKLTRLLMIETNNKGAEAHLKKLDDSLEGFDDEEFDTTVWVTDKEKFTRYEPDEEIINKSEEDIKDFIADIEKRKDENTGLMNSHPITIQDISDKPEEIQKIFKKTLARLNPDAELTPEKKCDNNVTMKALDVTGTKRKKKLVG